MNLEDSQTIRARSDKLSPSDLAVELVNLGRAFFGTPLDREWALGVLIFRGLTLSEATAIVQRLEQLEK